MKSRRLSRSSASWRPLGEKQAIGPPIPWVMPPFNEAMFNQPVEQAYQRNRLQFEHIGQIDLR